MKEEREGTAQSAEDLTGRWAVCSIGRIGHITGRKTLPWGESWVGIGLDGTEWASRSPKVICDADSYLLEHEPPSEEEYELAAIQIRDEDALGDGGTWARDAAEMVLKTFVANRMARRSRASKRALWRARESDAAHPAQQEKA